MKLIAFNGKVYRIHEEVYKQLQEGAEAYNKSLHTVTPNSGLYTDILDFIAENYKPFCQLDNWYSY